MGTMTFSIPDDVSEAFEKAFDGQNTNVILTRLMRDAVAAQDRLAARPAAVAAADALRGSMPRIGQDEVRKLREDARK